MLRARFIAVFAALCLCLSAGAQDIYGSVTAYLQAISVMPVDSITARLDALIASADNDDTRAGIAGLAYNFFLDSPVMGAEGVSVYLADNYFLNKRLKWPSEATWPSLYAFAEFNRQSLLGMEAPVLELESLEGETVNVRDFTGGCKVLYFYENSCATCARQTPLIVSYLKEYTGSAPLTFYAVYTQGDRDAWVKYAFANFHGIENPAVRVYNLWDPEGTSEFHKKYSVLTTPSLFVLDADNRIIGRKLDAAALGTLIGQEASFEASLYNLMEGIHDNMGLDRDAMADVCAAFESRIGSDTPLYRQTFLAIYNYLRGQGEYEALESAAFVAQKYILDRPDVWSPELVASAADAVHRFNLNPLGAVAADAVLLDSRGRERNLLSFRGRKHTVLFFNLIACSDCAAWKQQLIEMRSLLRRSGTRLVSIYVGPDPDEWKASLKCRTADCGQVAGSGPSVRKPCSCLWRDLRADWPSSDLFDKYDLSTAPRLYLLDSDGRIIAKDITPETLRKLLAE